MFQRVEFFDGKGLERWQDFLEDLAKDKADGILLLVAEKTPFDYRQLKPLFKRLKIKIWGGIFPEVIYNGLLHKQGVVGCTFGPGSLAAMEVVKSLDQFKGTFSKHPITEDTESLLILSDGYANNISFLIESLYEISAKDINFIGGGAGSLTNSEQSSLFTAEDFFSRGAIIASVGNYISVGIGHGWQSIHGPAIASDVENKVLKSIDWEPAFQYYKKVVEKDAGTTFKENNFLEIARSYPFGLLKYDNEIILRVPLGIDSANNILLGSEIPKNSMLMIMKASVDELVKAAGSAVERARTAFETNKKTGPTRALLIDCITRVLSLEDRFEDELKIITDKAGSDVMVFGFLSLGEIASIGDRYIELHNKTVVVGMGE